MIGLKKEPIDPILQKVTVRVWNLRSWIKFFPVITLIALVPTNSGIQLTIKILFLVYFSIFWTYSIRERWRLFITENSFQARQLLPRPFTFFTRQTIIPFKKIEGISIGPKAFNSILLLGIFIATNLGINFLKNGLLSNEVDLPDVIEGFIFILKGITFLPFLGTFADILQNWLEDLLSFIAKDVQITIGIAFLVIGIFLVILTIPRRHFLKVRVRYGPDFFLYAGVPNKFWHLLIDRIYDEKFVDPPKQYAKLKYPWLENEKVQSVADLEQTIYLNRIISIFAITVGIIRIGERTRLLGSNFFSTALHESVFWWMIIALMDLFIALLAFKFSKKKNEMIITNKRIIFVVEEPNISGSFGFRLYNISDIKKQDVAGFGFKKIRVFSFNYVVATVFTFTIFIIFLEVLPIYMRVIFGILIVVLIAFVNQTYLEFVLNTKGHGIWKLRHQLSNPATIMREMIGPENRVLQTLLTNRLEEKEVIQAVKTIRITDVHSQILNEENSESDPTLSNIKSKSNVKLEIEDLLFKDEKIVFQTNVSRKVPKRTQTLIISTILLLSFSVMSIVPVIILSGDASSVPNGLIILFPVYGFILIIMIIAIWIKYYSLYRATLLITKDRIFFQDKKAPHKLLYYLGVANETSIAESLRDQIHSTYSSRQINQKYALRAFIYHSIRWIPALTVAGMGVGILQSIDEIEYSFSDLAFAQFQSIIIVIVFLLGLFSAWHMANAFVEFIRGWPRRIFHAKGVGVHFEMPYATRKVAEITNYAIWSGINKEELK